MTDVAKKTQPMDSTQHEHPEMANVETVNDEYDETSGPRNDFWRTRTIDEIAAQQGIAVPQPLDQVIGAGADLWEDDGDCDRFVRGIHRPDPHRTRPTAAPFQSSP